MLNLKLTELKTYGTEEFQLNTYEYFISFIKYIPILKVWIKSLAI